MGKKSTPKPPDLKPLSDAQLEMSKQQLALAQQQMQMSADQFQRYLGLSQQELQQSGEQYDAQMALQQKALDQADSANATAKQVADAQIAQMNQASQYAQEDRQRYTDTILPLQDQYIAAAQAYASPEKQAAAAAQALADNQTQIEAQRSNQMAQLASMGVDPSQVMSTSLSSQLGVAGAAQGALGANAARENTIQTGYNMLGNAVNMGSGLPAQALSAMGTSTNAGNSAAGNSAQGAGLYSGASQIGATAAGIRQGSLGLTSQLTGSPMSWAQLGNQSYGGASNGIMNASSIQNQMFQNNMSAWNAKQQASQSTMNTIGSVAGIAAMAMMAEGGDVDSAPRYAMHAAEGTPRGAMLDDMRADWGAMANPKLQVSDIPMAPRGVTDHVKAHRAPLTSNQMQALSMAAQLGQQSEQPAYTDANLQQDWLRPIYAAEGGGAMTQGRTMPSMASRDRIPTMLSPGEYVIPADVVRHVGINHLEKMVNKYHRSGA